MALVGLTVLAVILPVYFTVIKPKKDSGDQQEQSEGNAAGDESQTDPTTGGDGSTVVMEDGTKFVYANKFGGFWVFDPKDPFNNNAQPNSWTPPLNQSWNWGKDRINGVNIGGLFVLEPFITPAFYQKYPGTLDEWSLSVAMAADTANGGLNQLEEHYKSFITEQDIAQIAGAGLNWIRLPIPYWAIETWPGEPFLEGTCWKYILRLLGWARKYGLRVKLDLHTIPGSQNGYNHSGKGGQVNFLHGVMGLANAQRALDYIRIITEFISQPEYQQLIPVFGVVNEPFLSVIGRSQLSSFYLEAHDMVRNITGYGEGHGPFISIHDGFQGMLSWANFLPGSDRIALDTHPYLAFSGSPATEPIATGTGDDAGGIWPSRACQSWADAVNKSRAGFGVTFAGEFSNGYNDCGLFLKGVMNSMGNVSYGGDCSFWEDSSQWNATIKAGVKRFAMASMDALQDYFFWTWKIGNAITSDRVEAPLWSYKLGLENGWMPTDPREAIGTCEGLGVSGNEFDGDFEPWQTGGSGAGTIAATATAMFPWPPVSFQSLDAPVKDLPTYTPTGTIITLPPPTFTLPGQDQTQHGGNGWYNPRDTASAHITVSGCSYPDGWDAVHATVPLPCGGDSIPTPTPTPTNIT
ncbi:glycoside hydrolase family 5 protein [Amanita thiersii Skay4041]|uniref:glucan 1,3-beta-glucosidase n=1 Tax=Amanita thiersii Skay4041 TaxID=703135 RepID=A0A2A9NIM5_9AGAR|nr:glycoside hydrolase family 5 protein [Amanita thiersii Skay4041]